MYCATSLTKNLDQVEFYYEATMKVPFLYEPWYYVPMFTYPNLFCIPQEDPHQIYPMEWGFIPTWAEAEIEAFRKSQSTFLVKAEEVLNSEMYSDAILRRRCLIITDGIFLNGNPDEDKGMSLYCYLKGHRPFTIAGVYNAYDEEYWSVSAVTIPHQSGIGRIPLILDPEFEKEWIDNDLKDVDLQEVLTTSFIRETLHKISVPNSLLKSDYGDDWSEFFGWADLL